MKEAEFNFALPSNRSVDKLLIEAKLISINQFQLAYREQSQSDLEIAEILVARGWIKAITLDFFTNQWSEMITAKSRKPLPFYLKESGLLSVAQINEILKLQKRSPGKKRFHHLVVECGYLKQATVNFFLAHFFNVYDPKTTISIPPHELVRNYAKGKKDFANTDLRSASLTGASLIGIILNGSNLKQANLSQANLSRSNLIRVNLNLANLTKTNLTQANLARSFLTQANLQSAYLDKANFSGAFLQSADLRSAYLAQTNFSGANLTGAKLDASYPYKVYYDSATVFDESFSPSLAGWQLRESN